MSWIPFFKKTSNECLGIDIGTNSIKVVEISKRGKEKKLESYGEIKVRDIYSDLKKSIINAGSGEIASFLRTVLKESGVKSKSAVISIPDYSSFFTTFTLPAMDKDEISEAVKFEAPVHIPLPSSKVSLDWQIVNNKGKKDGPIKILAVAVPNEIVDKYKEIASMINLELNSLEAEVFGLIRSSIKDDDLTVLMDIGKESTTCSIIEEKILKISHSFDAGGKEMTESLIKKMDIDYRKAEELKIKDGILGDKNIRECLLPIADRILGEVKDGCDNFLKSNGGKVRKMILSGGPALLPGLREYFIKESGMKVEIANPFSELITPDVLKKSLKEMGPFYAVSVGMALGKLK